MYECTRKPATSVPVRSSDCISSHDDNHPAPLQEPWLLSSLIGYPEVSGRATCSAFAEPSDGLEPSTPSLPSLAACRVASSWVAPSPLAAWVRRRRGDLG